MKIHSGIITMPSQTDHLISEVAQIEVLSAIPESVHDEAQVFLQQHPGWDWDRIVTEGLRLLLQNSSAIEV